MDVYQNIWSSCDKEQLVKHRQLISDAAVNQGLFQNEDDKLLKAHVREVNSLLNNNKTRDRGLSLLVDLVPQCAQQVLSAQCERWFRFCCDAITGGKQSRRAVQGCQVLSGLLHDLPSLPELQRCVASKASAAIVPELVAIDPQINPAALECLYEYVRAAPGPCLQHKTVLEERILHHLDHPVTPASLERSVVRLAGKVFAAMPLPGVGGGNVAQSRSDAKGRQLALLLGLAHTLMDTLLDGVLERQSYPHSRDHSSLKLRSLEDVAPEPLTARLVSIARLSNTLIFVAEMITDPCNTTITITPEHLLGVVFRLLQMECSVLARYKSQEHKLVAFFLPSLHNQALLLLRDMIISLGDGIDSYYNTISELLVSVARSYKSPGAKNKAEQPVWCRSGLQTRVLTFGVLAELVRASRGQHTPPTGLIRMVVENLSPQEHRVKLQEKGLASLSLHKASGKKKGYSVTSQASSCLSGPLPRPERFGRLARVALVVAEMLFTHATHAMDFENHQRLQNGVLAIAEGVVGASHPPDIYRDPKVRVQLFLTLAALSATPHPRCPPPYTLLTHLLQTAAMDSDTQVAMACQSALCAISLIVANPKVELASQAFRQHQQGSGGGNYNLQDEEQDEEVDMIIEELQKEEEEEEVTEEEPIQMNRKKQDEADDEENKNEEEEEEESEGKEKEGSEEEEEEELAKAWIVSEDSDEKEEKGDSDRTDPAKEEEVKKGRGGDNKREKNGKGKTEGKTNNQRQSVDKTEAGMEEEIRDKMEEEDEEETKNIKKRSRRGKKGKGRINSGEKEQTQQVQTKASEKQTESKERMKNKKKGMEEKEEEASGSITSKRNGSTSDSPAKRVKSSSDQESSKEGSRELTVEEMLKDFVG